MKSDSTYIPDSKLDLVLERIIDIPPESIWTAWTTPDHVTKWFTPAPWTTVGCQIDLRPGGIFRTVMRSPEGQERTNIGCYLEVVRNKRLVWTDALLPGFRPNNNIIASAGMPFTAVILMERQGTETKYTAIVMHKDEDACKKHEQMGFHAGWGAALDQLVALAKEF